MKKGLVFFALVIIIIGGLLISSCGGTTTLTTTTTTTTTSTTTTTTSTTTTTTTTSTQSTSPTQTTTTSTGVTPVFGGIFRIITTAGPTVLGGPAAGPGDYAGCFPGQNAFMDASADRSSGIGIEPVLCTSVDEDMANSELVFHLRHGVLFHDGSELTADVAMWNYQQSIDSGRMWGLNYYDGMVKIDDYTFAIKWKQYSNLLIQNWAWISPQSEAAYEAGTAGMTTDAEKTNWQATHFVGTGPFYLKEYVKDDHMIWMKFNDYWNAPLPYVDEFYYRFIPDAVTARAVMEAGQADYWLSATARDRKEMSEEGFKLIQGWPGLVMDIYPNTADPTSIWNDLNLRMALDYALDKAAIANALGAGQYIPLYQLAPPGEWGYDPNYPERHYDVAKALQLVTASYPNGLPTQKLLIGNDSASLDAGTALKGYLDAAGIPISLDVADPGRQAALIWGSPQEGLAFYLSGMDVNNLLTYLRWFSTDPFANVRYLGRTEDQKALDDVAKAAPDVASQKAAADACYKYMNDQARLCPVYLVPSAAVAQSYVHSQEYQQGFVRWQTELVWMEKH
jgi:ABC-type transport system substrate-binding protein